MVRILINTPSNGHWLCHLSQYRVQTSLAWNSSKEFGFWSLLSSNTKIYRIWVRFTALRRKLFNRQQQSYLTLAKTGERSSECKSWEQDLSPEAEAAPTTAGVTDGGWRLEVVSCPLEKKQQVQDLINSFYIFNSPCHRAYLQTNISCLHLSPKEKKNISLNFSFLGLSLHWCCRSSLLWSFGIISVRKICNSLIFILIWFPCISLLCFLLYFCI